MVSAELSLMIHTPSSHESPAAMGLSIVTVCLNDLAGLRATYRSIVDQTEQPDEWLICDGGSSDGTVEWLQELTAVSPLSWSSQADGGIYHGMNHGLSRARFEYVLFLNSGDTLGSERTVAQVRLALRNSPEKPALLFGNCYEVTATGSRFLRRARPAWWVWLGMPTSHQAMIFRRACLPHGFDTRYRWSADYAAVSDLFMSSGGTDFSRIDEALCHFKLGGRSDLHRSQFLCETRDVRRRILRMHFVSTWVLHAAHHVQGWIKKSLPSLHRAIRYD